MLMLIGVPFALLLVLFALSNPQTVTFGLWPTDFTIDLPLSIAMLGAMAIAFLVGALVMWVARFGVLARARRAERANGLLEAQIKVLQARSASTGLPAPR